MKLDHVSDTADPAFATVSVVHDLGNLIQIAASAISVIARTPDMPARHAGPMLHRAKNCLEHAGALVRQSMGLMRSRMAVDSSSVAACLDEVAALVDSMCEPEIGLALDIEPGLPEVRCDPLSLHSAVLNLVLNAREAMAGRGLIAIRGRVIAAGSVVTGVEISVADDGVGMSPTTIAAAFDPFFTTKSDGVGGIGLPMVERFVRDTGGEILIESEPGIGTTVFLRLPASAPIINGE